MAEPSRNNAQRQGMSRRRLAKGLFALPLASLVAGPALARRTPAATEGPFYPTPSMRFADADNNLVKITGRVRQAGGEVVVLKGVVRDTGGEPIAGARVEIWQCDVNGRYLHTGDRSWRRRRDPGFQGFGHVVTGSDGAYAFRTIKPVSYPGRTPHIHVKVFAGGREFTTQFYIDGHPQNTRDLLFQRMSSEEQQAVAMRFVDGVDGVAATVDIVV